jgi:hypothetical protein
MLAVAGVGAILAIVAGLLIGLSQSASATDGDGSGSLTYTGQGIPVDQQCDARDPFGANQPYLLFVFAYGGNYDPTNVVLHGVTVLSQSEMGNEMHIFTEYVDPASLVDKVFVTWDGEVGNARLVISHGCAGDTSTPTPSVTPTPTPSETVTPTPSVTVTPTPTPTMPTSQPTQPSSSATPTPTGPTTHPTTPSPTHSTKTPSTTPTTATPTKAPPTSTTTPSQPTTGPSVGAGAAGFGPTSGPTSGSSGLPWLPSSLVVFLLLAAACFRKPIMAHYREHQDRTH